MYYLVPDQIEYKHFNERDIEIPTLLNSVSEAIEHGHIRSLLDVGAAGSHYYYAESLAELLGLNREYIGVDIETDKEAEKIVDRYLIGNVMDLSLSTKFSYVSCVSTIEHCGLTTYKVDNFRAEQDRVFRQLLNISNYGVFLSFPFGMDQVFPGQYANITDPMLRGWQDLAASMGFAADMAFWFNEFPQGRELWSQVDRAEARSKPLLPEKGAQCICMVEFARDGL